MFDSCLCVVALERERNRDRDREKDHGRCWFGYSIGTAVGRDCGNTTFISSAASLDYRLDLDRLCVYVFVPLFRWHSPPLVPFST